MSATYDCPDCGGLVSKKAKACPSCGAPLAKGFSFLQCFMVGLLFVLAVQLFWASPQTSEHTGGHQYSSSRPVQRVADRSPEKQAERLALLKDLQARGVFYQIKVPARMPHATVGNAWIGLDYDDKVLYSNAALTYYAAADARADILVLKDRRTGKKIGAYTFDLGLKID